MAKRRTTNRLIKEKSPYLLQYAHNPVDWYPWGGEALAKAKREDKPIFLSIGYSTCHWCHVQNEESFEDEKIAAILNEKFVPIKVDREERPDLDEIYMKAVTALTGSGGWPLSVFLTPEGKPFYGGTYFPPVARNRLPGFPDVLNFVADRWKNRREELTERSDELTQLIKSSYKLGAEGDLSKALLDNGYAALTANHDPEFGGFGRAPKFPLPSYLGFLLRYHSRTREANALGVVLKTLDSMAEGGIHDQLAGGFHRYSTDRYWLVPHFEKMLYDNSLLARVYADAYRVTRDEKYAAPARGTLDWMLEEMLSKEGGFYSAQDADTADGEGYYYTWTPAEVSKVVGEKEGAIMCDYFGVSAEGNFEGRSILTASGSPEKTAKNLGISADEVSRTIEGARPRLLEARRERDRPMVDDKVLASWNGLAISAFANASQAFDEERYLRAGERCADFLLTTLVKDGDKLYRRYRDGDVAIEGNLEDYAFLVAGLIDLYEASFEERWLSTSLALVERMVELFWDAEGGGFFMSPSGGDLAAIKEGYDGPTPSGMSVAALDLLRLAEFTGRKDMRDKAETTLKLFAERMESTPTSYTEMLGAVDFYLGSREIVVASPGPSSQLDEVLSEIRGRYLPTKVLAMAAGPGSPVRPLTDGKTSSKGLPTVYVCENFACRAPVTDLAALRAQLDAVPATAEGGA